MTRDCAAFLERGHSRAIDSSCYEDWDEKRGEVGKTSKLYKEPPTLVGGLGLESQARGFNREGSETQGALAYWFLRCHF